MSRSSSWIRTAVTFVALAAASGAVRAQATKIGIVDTDRLVAQSAAGKEMFARLKKLAAEKNEQLKPKEDEINALQKKITDGQVSLSSEKLAELTRQRDEKVTAIRRLQEDMQKEFEEARGGAETEFMKKLLPILDQYAKDEGYDLVLNGSFFNQPNAPTGLLWVSDKSDITDALVQKLDAQNAAAAKP